VTAVVGAPLRSDEVDLGPEVESSAETLFDELLDGVMRLVLESSGAQRGVLLLERGGEPSVVAQAQVGDRGVSVDIGEGRLARGRAVPWSVVSWARRSGEPVLLADAADPNPFSADAYLVERSPRSVLCLPLVREDEVVGLVYAEHGVTADVFTTERLRVLELIASQAAVSLENARLCSALERENRDRRRAQEEQGRLEAEIRQSQKMEAVGRLAGGVAHEFNNLLTAISGYSELLLEQLPDEGSMRSDAEEITRATERAAGLTRRLLTFSRRRYVHRESLELNGIVSDMDRLLRRLIGADVELVTVLAPELALVEGDRGELEQVIVNLALNARDAMPRGGKLVIETANLDLEEPLVDRYASLGPGRYVTVSMRDTGVGMEADTVGKIFEPFFTTKDVGHGTGLGLSIVFGIVEESGGRIFVYSEPERGATFKICLPASHRRRAAAAGEAGPVTASSLEGSETILLIEDDEVLRSLAARALRGHGYEVLEARYGSEALELWRARPDEVVLVVSDVVMPGMSGVEVAERLVAERPDLLVLLMSGFADSPAAAQLPRRNRAGFLEKPFTPGVLLQAVRVAIDEHVTD
jgi:signal transduction histidine kinase/ActR/RegA family two-component response regulator